MKIFFDLFLDFIKVIVSFFMGLVDPLISNVFPDFSGYVAQFYQWTDTYIGGGLVYFFHLLPPNARSLIILYLVVLGTIYVVDGAIHIVLYIIEVLQNIKVW